MKKTVSVIALSAVATLALSACGGAPAPSESSASSSGNTQASSFKGCVVSDQGGFNDKSFNQSAKEGIDKAAKEFGFKAEAVESRTDSDYTPNLEAMVQAKCTFILGVGFAMSDQIAEVAKAHPEVNFALVDSSFTVDHKPVTLPNAKPLLFNPAEAAYLAGYVAAAQTKTGKVGVYLGQPHPSTMVFADGFADGIAAYNKAKNKDVKLIGWDKATQTGVYAGSFRDASKGKLVTDNLVSQGADIIMPVAGATGFGTLQVAQAKTKAGSEVSTVWVDADGYYTAPDYKNIILTSVMKLIGNAVYDTTKMAKEGKFDSSIYVGTLANGGVDIAPFHDFASKISDETKQEVAKLKKEIASGAVKVESVNTPK